MKAPLRRGFPDTRYFELLCEPMQTASANVSPRDNTHSCILYAGMRSHLSFDARWGTSCFLPQGVIFVRKPFL